MEYLSAAASVQARLRIGIRPTYNKRTEMLEALLPPPQKKIFK